MAQATTRTGAYFNPNRPGEFIQVTDTAANDSDKTITVPAGKVWEVLYVFASLVTTATIGNRQIQLDLRDDSDNVMGQSSALNVQTASGTESYHWRPSNNTATEDVATEHWMPLPDARFLPPGYDMRIYDSAAIDAAADDLTIRMQVIQYNSDADHYKQAIV